MCCLLFILMVDSTSAQAPISTRNEGVLGTTVRYLEAGVPASMTVLLLHGGRFTSETWRELGTITTLADAGYHVVALDLPGYGDSAPSAVPREEYLDRALGQLWPTTRFVIVSPSMSGGYSLPFVVAQPARVAGYVPVAPVGVAQHRDALGSVTVPAMVVWGEQDRVIPVAQAHVLAAALNGEILILSGAGHPAYLDRPDEFHRALLDFLGRL